MSPAARRVIAVCLLILMALLLIVLVIAPLSQALSDTRVRLEEARYRLARLEALAARPVPNPGRKLPPGATLGATDRASAEAAFGRLLDTAARRNGLSIASPAIATEDQTGRRLSASFSASGPEINLIRFISELENGQPLIRFRTWRLARGTGDTPELKLDATALLVWSAQR